MRRLWSAVTTAVKRLPFVRSPPVPSSLPSQTPRTAAAVTKEAVHASPPTDSDGQSAGALQRIKIDVGALSERQKEAHQRMQEAMAELSKDSVQVMADKLQKLSQRDLHTLGNRDLLDLARHYTTGYLLEKDDEKAFRCLRLAADKGSVEAQMQVAICRIRGRGTPENHEEGLKELGRIAAEERYPAAYYSLGVVLMEGVACPRSPELAVQLLEVAAKARVPGAANNLANAYAEGVGVERDEQRALELYASAVKDHQDEMAMFTLAQWIKTGRGGLKLDPAEALELELRAAHKQHPIAAYNVGIAFLEGIGTNVDRNAARLWLEHALSLKFQLAGLYLARLLMEDKKYEEAKSALNECTGIMPLAQRLFVLVDRAQNGADSMEVLLAEWEKTSVAFEEEYQQQQQPESSAANSSR